ncbi:4Fe-4S single cluster domain-containing protein [Micromonospora nigra]|uniref:4Fe-4S single cluster domain-containing protein n=1 Tax=Micromonospora nigra TaxID=145857 RepID=A0A1C6RCX0_9ACTN|nr:radical SAM protein [Micromonospora nigra]SCL14996.1 4Fe-4S single cluster domain-containing protein [Micromonospora nigra]
MTRIAICGGVYSNPYALRAFVADARAKGADRLWCLGDFGGYGAEPEEIWTLLRGNDIECIAGNYEVAIGRGDPDCGCGYRDPRDNEYAQLMYDYTRTHTSAGYAAWMRSLPTERRERVDGVDVHLVHGSTLQLNDFWWESLTDQEHRERVAASGADVICCTHSGIPWTRRIDGTLVVNVGVLGRPANDGRQEVWYALLDVVDGAAEATLVPLAYDWRAHAASMRAAGLPEAFVETVETGWWTTCLEIVPPQERSHGRFQLYRSALPDEFGAAEVSWADAPDTVDDGRPVVELFGTALFPPRLWLYTNFHCNLKCWYCSVASHPKARPREISGERYRELVDEAVAEGFTELYVTGGEPFLRADVVELLEYASERIATVALTNGLLYKGRRRTELARLAHRPNLILQTSIDGARAETHDRNRGEGSWVRAMEGIEIAQSLGMPVRVGMTETAQNQDEVPLLRELLRQRGIVGANFAVRPLVRRGHSDTGVEIDDQNTVPELAVTADGWHWHPAGADLATSPDMLLGPSEISMREAKRRAVERFLVRRQSDGSLPQIYHCAV